jgi:hypothetical protein
MLRLMAVSLAVSHRARTKTLVQSLRNLLPIEVLEWLGLARLDGQAINRSQIHYFFRILHRSYNCSILRMQDERPLTNAERERNEQRFNDLINRIATGWLPRDFPTGDLLALDTTALESAAKPLNKKLRKALLKEHSLDLLLREERTLPPERQKQLRRQRQHRAVEARWGYHTPTYAAPRKTIGGFHIHTCVSGPTTGDEAPVLLLQLAVTPASGYRARDMARMLMGRVDALWGNHHVIVADDAYSQALGLWEDLRQSHREFAFDLNEQQLPPRGAHRGAILAQGNALCPGTPQHLRNPGKRPLAHVKGDAHNPEHAAWLARVQAQRPFHARIRSRRPDGVNVSCPDGVGVDCALRALLQGRAPQLDPEGRRPVVLNPPREPTALCMQQTVWIPDTVNPLRQTLPWGSKQWEQAHSRGRALVEGEHGRIKHPDGQDLTRWVVSSSYPEVVGLAVAIVAALENLRAVREWLSRHPEHPVAQRLAGDLLFASDETLVTWLAQELQDFSRRARKPPKRRVHPSTAKKRRDARGDD